MQASQQGAQVSCRDLVRSTVFFCEVQREGGGVGQVFGKEGGGSQSSKEGAQQLVSWKGRV